MYCKSHICYKKNYSRIKIWASNAYPCHGKTFTMVKSENNFFTQGNMDNFRRPFFLLYDSFRVYTYIFSHITVWYEQPMLYTVPRGRSKWSIKKHVVFLTVPPVLLEEKNRTSMSHPKAQFGPSQRQGLSCWQGQAQSRYRPLSTCLHGPSQPATSAEQPGPDAGRDEIRPCLLLCCLPAGLVVPSRSRANLVVVGGGRLGIPPRKSGSRAWRSLPCVPPRRAAIFLRAGAPSASSIGGCTVRTWYYKGGQLVRWNHRPTCRRAWVMGMNRMARSTSPALGGVGGRSGHAFSFSHGIKTSSGRSPTARARGSRPGNRTCDKAGGNRGRT